MNKQHNIRNINFVGNHMHIEIDGKAYVYPLNEISASLANIGGGKNDIRNLSVRIRHTLAPAG